MNILLFSGSDIYTSLYATTDILIDKMVHCERGLLTAVAVLVVMAEVGHSLDMQMELAFVVYLFTSNSYSTVIYTSIGT